MRSLLMLLIAAAVGFVLVAMFVAPSQPALRDWYQANACPHLDRLTTQICDPIRNAQVGERT